MRICTLNFDIILDIILYIGERVIMLVYNWDQIIGLNKIKDWLLIKLAQDNMPQVLMFAGQPGIGKTSLAKVLACELACLDCPERVQEVKDRVIGQSQSTDCVKIYNMSNLRSNDAINDVKNDLTIGLSTTGRKVIIMDEAHGMTGDQQDYLLTSFEALDKHVYIIICTTDVSSLRDAFLSRCIVRNFSTPTQSEVKTLIMNEIQANKLQFNIPINMVLAFIMSATHNEPRRIKNIISAMTQRETDVLTKEDLIEFGLATDDRKYFRLIQYLYGGNIVDGLQYIADLTDGFNEAAITLYLEMVKVALSSTSYMISREVQAQILDIVNIYGAEKLIKFVTYLSTAKRPSRNYVSGIFLRLTEDVYSAPKKVYDIHTEDMGIMVKTEQDNKVDSDFNPSAITLEDLINGADLINNKSE